MTWFKVRQDSQPRIAPDFQSSEDVTKVEPLGSSGVEELGIVILVDPTWLSRSSSKWVNSGAGELTLYTKDV